jgi:hypothetical protein
MENDKNIIQEKILDKIVNFVTEQRTDDGIQPPYDYRTCRDIVNIIFKNNECLKLISSFQFHKRYEIKEV